MAIDDGAFYFWVISTRERFFFSFGRVRQAISDTINPHRGDGTSSYSPRRISNLGLLPHYNQVVTSRNMGTNLRRDRSWDKLVSGWVRCVLAEDVLERDVEGVRARYEPFLILLDICHLLI